MLAEIARFVFPGWISDPNRLHWRSYFDVMAVVIDSFVSLAEEGALASMPGQVDGVAGMENLNGFWQHDALKLIGEDRLTFQGLAESPADYALRLRRYLDSWTLAGTVFGILSELAGVLTANGYAAPLLRIVTSAGDWYTRHPDGTLRMQRVSGKGFYISPDGTSGPDTTTAHAWDWDSNSKPVPPDQNDGTRFWVIIYAPASQPYLTMNDGIFTDPGLCGDGWNDPTHGGYENSPDAGTVGTNAPAQLVDLVRSVVEQRRSAGYRCAWIIVALDPNSFKPDGTSAGTNAYPNGLWAWHSKYDGGSNSRIVARNTSAEYWKGV